MSEDRSFKTEMLEGEEAGVENGPQTIYLPSDKYQEWEELVRRYRRRANIALWVGLLVSLILVGTLIYMVPPREEVPFWFGVFLMFASVSLFFIGLGAGCMVENRRGRVGRELEGLIEEHLGYHVSFSLLAVWEDQEEEADFYIVRPSSE